LVKRDPLETLDKLDHKASRGELEQQVHKVTRVLLDQLDLLAIKVQLVVLA